MHKFVPLFPLRNDGKSRDRRIKEQRCYGPVDLALFLVLLKASPRAKSLRLRDRNDGKADFNVARDQSAIRRDFYDDDGNG
jgi:hypothetical protein